MADQMRMTIYNNLVKKSGMQNSFSSNVTSGVNRLNNKEEQLLKGLANKGRTANTAVKNSYVSQNTYGALNTVNKSVVSTTTMSSNKPVQKINLEDLVKKTPKSETKEIKRNSTAMTLEELASKCKKTSDLENKENQVKTGAREMVNNNVNVKSNVIGNVSSIESLIPKISLNSIGKSNSLLK
jgi:hypothetical protein